MTCTGASSGCHQKRLQLHQSRCTTLLENGILNNPADKVFVLQVVAVVQISVKWGSLRRCATMQTRLQMAGYLEEEPQRMELLVKEVGFNHLVLAPLQRTPNLYDDAPPSMSFCVCLCAYGQLNFLHKSLVSYQLCISSWLVCCRTWGKL